MLFWSSKAVLSTEILMLNFAISSLFRVMKSGNFKCFYLQKGARLNHWPESFNVVSTCWVFFIPSLSWQSDTAHIFQLWRLQKKQVWWYWPFPNRIFSACHKIILPYLPSLLTKDKTPRNYALQSNKQHMLLASPWSTSVDQLLMWVFKLK